MYQRYFDFSFENNVDKTQILYYNQRCQTNLINVETGVLSLFIGIVRLFFSHNYITEFDKMQIPFM